MLVKMAISNSSYFHNVCILTSFIHFILSIIHSFLTTHQSSRADCVRLCSTLVQLELYCYYLGHYVFSVLCRASVVLLLFISYTFAVHLLSPCCASHVFLFCLSSTSCTSLALSKFFYSSSDFHLRTLRRSQDAL